MRHDDWSPKTTYLVVDMYDVLSFLFLFFMIINAVPWHFVNLAPQGGTKIVGCFDGDGCCLIVFAVWVTSRGGTSPLRATGIIRANNFRRVEFACYDETSPLPAGETDYIGVWYFECPEGQWAREYYLFDIQKVQCVAYDSEITGIADVRVTEYRPEDHPNGFITMIIAAYNEGPSGYRLRNIERDVFELPARPRWPGSKS